MESPRRTRHHFPHPPPSISFSCSRMDRGQENQSHRNCVETVINRTSCHRQQQPPTQTRYASRLSLSSCICRAERLQISPIPSSQTPLVISMLACESPTPHVALSASSSCQSHPAPHHHPSSAPPSPAHLASSCLGTHPRAPRSAPPSPPWRPWAPATGPCRPWT